MVLLQMVWHLSATFYLFSVLMAIVLYFLVSYNWKRRWLYYCSLKLPGPISLPLVGSLQFLMNSPEEFYQNALQLSKKYPWVFRVWIGKDLFIVNSSPQDAEILLSTFLEKAPFYKLLVGDLLGDGLFTGKLQVWKQNRKIINPTFNTKVLNSYVERFAKNSLKFVEKLEKGCDGEEIDILLDAWRLSLDSALETLFGVDSTLITGQDDYIRAVYSYENTGIKRLFSPWLLHRGFFLKFSKLAEDHQRAITITHNFIKKIIEIKKSQQMKTFDEKEDILNKNFLHHVLHESEINENFTEINVYEETQTILATGRETSAYVISTILVILGILPEIQEKVYQEMLSIFGNNKRNVSLEDLTKMKYLESVIKETMRLFPIGPGVLRYVDKNLKLNGIMYPKGSSVYIFIRAIHLNPEIWSNPMTFDPDRFLTDNSNKRHRCSYIPFSYGSRNCIGYKYAMLLLKVTISTIIRNYKIYSKKYKSIEDIKLSFTPFLKARDGYWISWKKRKEEMDN